MASAGLDSIVTAVIQRFTERAEMGKKKYGTDLDRTDLSILDWIQHAQEEHMDAILYLEKLKREYSTKVRQEKIETPSASSSIAETPTHGH